ncbi:hypothetical protein QR680_018669 [Steinernema hermaphroditum]|uniref:Uncharacterized protein n=1 Tax=Steinernema hermaphroditum TaxID=289476 RepID=A0AA39HIN1_9BILA|nr:hypothetical protein QR680_018669 [Steinernema hermaphroditum]
MFLSLLVIYVVAIVVLFFIHKARIEAGEPGVPFLGRQFNRFLPQSEDILIDRLSAPLSSDDIEQSLFPDLKQRRSRKNISGVNKKPLKGARKEISTKMSPQTRQADVNQL